MKASVLLAKRSINLSSYSRNSLSSVSSPYLVTTNLTRKRGYVSKTNTKNENQGMIPSMDMNMNMMSSPTSSNDFDHDSIYELAPPESIKYLKTLPKQQLFSLAMIGIVTLNKTILDLCIKVFPYVPAKVIKFLISDLYCGGETIEEVQQCGKKLQKRGISNMMLSLTIEDSEGVKNIDINYIVNETIRSIHSVLKPNLIRQIESCSRDKINNIAPGYIALKPSALVSNPSEVLLNFNNPDPYWVKQRNILVENCSKITKEIYDLNQSLLKKYPERIAPFFLSTIDAEKFELQTHGVYDLQRLLFKKFNPIDSPIVSVIGTWQLYLKDSFAHLDKEYKLAEKGGYKLGLKLVRGAYIHTEKDRLNIIHEDKFSTDRNYNNIMTMVINDMNSKGQKSYYGHLVIASHNYHSQLIATNILKLNKDKPYVLSNVTLGQLLGMADNVTHELIETHNVKNIIKYVPWGPAVETKDYLLRRLQENGDAVRSDNGWHLLKNIFLGILNGK